MKAKFSKYNNYNGLLAVKNLLLNSVVFIIISLFVFQIYNNTVYTHFHKLSDGGIIVHAHPFDKSENEDPGKTHQHTQPCLLCLATNDILFEFSTFQLCLSPEKYVIQTFDYEVSFHDQMNESMQFGRAPPSNI